MLWKNWKIKETTDEKINIITLDKSLFPEKCFDMSKYTKNLEQTKKAKIKRWLSVRITELWIF